MCIGVCWLIPGWEDWWSLGVLRWPFVLQQPGHGLMAVTKGHEPEQAAAASFFFFL